MRSSYSRNVGHCRQIDTETVARSYPRTWRRWIARWSTAGSEQFDRKPEKHRGVLCSIDRPPVDRETQDDISGTGGVALKEEDPSVDTSVAIGGVEDLLEFVRSSVLAGPRPFSFAFHERSLRSVLVSECCTHPYVNSAVSGATVMCHAGDITTMCHTLYTTVMCHLGNTTAVCCIECTTVTRPIAYTTVSCLVLNEQRSCLGESAAVVAMYMRMRRIFVGRCLVL